MQHIVLFCCGLCGVCVAYAHAQRADLYPMHMFQQETSNKSGSTMNQGRLYVDAQHKPREHCMHCRRHFGMGM